MGKVRPKLVKRIARELLSKYPELFKRDFEHNKKAVSMLTIVSSKKLRNQIAGYITHLLAVEARREKRVEVVEEVSEASA